MVLEEGPKIDANTAQTTGAIDAPLLGSFRLVLTLGRVETNVESLKNQRKDRTVRLWTNGPSTPYHWWTTSPRAIHCMLRGEVLI